MVKNLKSFFKRFGVLFARKDVFFMTAAITFYLLISTIPFALILTSIMGFVLTDEQALMQISRFMSDFLPSFFFDEGNSDVQADILAFLSPLVERRRVYGIIGFSILTVTSLGLFAAVKHVLYTIFDIKDEKHPFQGMIYNFFAFGMIGAVFIFFSIALSIISLVTFKSFNLPYFDIVIDLGIFFELISILFPVIFNLTLFYVFFRYVSERNINRLTCLFGAGTYTFLFEMARYLFGFYLGYFFSRFQFIYQSYSILILLGFWAFYGALTFTISSLAARSFNDVYEVGKFLSGKGKDGSNAPSEIEFVNN